MMGLTRALVAYYHAVPATLRGMVLVFLAAFSVNAMNVVLREAAIQVHIFEIGFIRHVFAFLFFVPVFMRSGTNIFVTRRLGLLTVRAVLNVTAMLLYYFAVMMIPLAEIMALGFTTPLFVTILAVIFLGEKMASWRWIGLGLGLAGALIILRPGLDVIATGSLLVLASSSIWAFALIVIKVLTRTESTMTITMYASLLQIPFSLVPAVFYWTWPTAYQLWLIALIAFFGTLSHLCIAQAFREADATVVMPVDFTKLIWAGLIGYFIFAEVPEIWTLLGGAVVFSGVFYIGYRERNAGRARAPAK